MDTRLHGFRVALLAALGLAPVGACGGSSEPGGNGGGDAGAPEAGSPTQATGGAKSSGGRPGSGGATSTGGRATTGTGGRLSATGGTGIATAGTFAGGAIGTGASAGSIGQGGSPIGGSGGSPTGTGGSTVPEHPKPCAPLPNTAPAPAADRIVARPAQTQACDGGWRHIPVPVSCASSLPRSEPVEPLAEGNCTEDADCTERDHGYCAPGPEPTTGNYCRYGCVDSSDCGEGYLCECGPLIGACVPSNCQSDADCGDLLCASYTDNPGCNVPAFACQTPEDECTSDADCGDAFCTLVGDHRECQTPMCVIGRPFLIDGQERLASVEGRSDWLETEIAPSLGEIAAPTRAALAEAWTRIALMEHASIAAFARFTLELLALGAPAELVTASSSAMNDEIAHARQAFALASTYAGSALGPSVLDIGGSLCSVELETCAANAFLEGCIGETVAALEAREAADLCRDPAVRRVLSQVADEEARHALLAFEFIKWALPQSRSLGATLEDALASEIAMSKTLECAGVPQNADVDVDTLAAHGILPQSLRRALRARVLEDIVAPCLAELRHNAGPFSSGASRLHSYTESSFEEGVAAGRQS